MARVWAGVDAGKTHHHCVVIDADGGRLLSRRVANDEPELLGLIGDVTALAGEVTWAAGRPDGGAALLIGLLLDASQELPQHRDFLAQHQKLGVLRSRRACQQRHPAGQADEHQIDHSYRHEQEILPGKRRSSSANHQLSQLRALFGTPQEMCAHERGNRREFRRGPR
jgi:hypothetical protein